MSTLMSRGMSMLSRQLAVAASPDTAITFKMTSADSATSLPSWHGTPGRRISDSTNTVPEPRREFDSRDFCGPWDELNQNPAEGMRFTEVINGISYVFECRPGSGEPAWDWQDAEKTRVRVHCKRAVV